MPAALHQKLEAIARRRGYGKKRAGAYVYGTMAKVDKGEMRGAMERRLKG